MAKPEKTFQHGACKAAVFINTVSKNGQELKIPKVVLQKSYRDKEGNWSTTDSYDVNDLPKLIVTASKAYQYLTEKQKNGEE